MCSQLLYNPHPHPFSASTLAYCLLQLKVYVCGLSLDEQSYYEKSNPSLGDRGVTQDLKDTEQPDVFLGTQIPSSKRICAMKRNNTSCHIYIFSLMKIEDKSNPNHLWDSASLDVPDAV